MNDPKLQAALGDDLHDALEAEYADRLRAYARDSGQVECFRYHDTFSVRVLGMACPRCGAQR